MNTSTTKHTAEPWIVIDKSKASDGNGFSVAQAPGDYGQSITGWGCVEQTKANAARIVAVINAMAGIDDPADFVKRALAAGVHK